MLNQLFVEVLLTRFGTNQVERISKGIEKVKPVLDWMFASNEAAQRVAIETIFKSFNMDSLSAQDFKKENLFQVRSKVISLVMVLVKDDVVSPTTAMNWCVEQLEKLEGDLSLNFTHSYLLMTLMEWIQVQREHLTTTFVQETNKVEEVRVETPYEVRMRE